ncbi:MAG: DUF2339 domain-containing protein, partial [Puniceicoccales bacterium]
AFTALSFFLAAVGVWTFSDASYFPLWLSGLIIAASLLWRWRERASYEITLTGLVLAWIYSVSNQIVEPVNAFFAGSPITSAWTPGPFSVLEILTWTMGAIGLCMSLPLAINCRSRDWKQALSWLTGIVVILSVSAWCSLFQTSAAPWSQQAQWDAGLTTTVFVAIAVLLLLLSRRYPLFQLIGKIGFGLVAIRLLFVHLFAPSAVGESFFWNALLWQFGVPLAGFLLATQIAYRENLTDRFKMFCLSACMITSWVWITFLIQDYFDSRTLFSSVQTDSEMYAYSAAWLILAVIFQSFGLWRNLRLLHIGSLILLIITVGKVFLIDTAALTGLFRVLSFFGLGLALLGIGFFYNKVVFAR